MKPAHIKSMGTTPKATKPPSSKTSTGKMLQAKAAITPMASSEEAYRCRRPQNLPQVLLRPHQRTRPNRCFAKKPSTLAAATQEEIFDATRQPREVAFRPHAHAHRQKKTFLRQSQQLHPHAEERALPQNKNHNHTLRIHQRPPYSHHRSPRRPEEEKNTKYVYNSYGELETTIHADGTILNHRYDAKGRFHTFTLTTTP